MPKRRPRTSSEGQLPTTAASKGPFDLRVDDTVIDLTDPEEPVEAGRRVFVSYRTGDGEVHLVADESAGVYGVMDDLAERLGKTIGGPEPVAILGFRVEPEPVDWSDSTDWAAAARVGFVIDKLGGPSETARLLGVSRQQPGRWSSGQQAPAPEHARVILDLDHVLAYAVQVWDPSIVPEWLATANAHLGGARPIDVLRVDGSAEVIDALRAEAAGAFA